MSQMSQSDVKCICDNCEHIICEPPDEEGCPGIFACSKGHWEGIGGHNADPKQWKWCKDYKPKQ